MRKAFNTPEKKKKEDEDEGPGLMDTVMGAVTNAASAAKNTAADLLKKATDVIASPPVGSEEYQRMKKKQGDPKYQKVK